MGQAQPPGPPGAACGSRAWPTGRLAAAGLSHVAAGRVPVTPSLRARPPWHSVSDSDCQGNCHSPGTTQWQVAALPGPVAGSRDSRLPLGPTVVTECVWDDGESSDVFGMTGKAADTWEKSEVRFGRSAAVGLSAEVTRKIGPQHGLDIDPISFLVESSSEESGNSRYFFIKFNEDHGASIVDVLQVIRPRAMEAGQSYNRTMQYRQICSTPEALQCTDKEADDPSIGLLGRSGLRTLLERRHELYHSGDVVQFGDIRTLIGVIKWYPETFENEHKLSRGYFRNYPRADVIRVGAHFSQTRGAGGP